MIIPAGIRLILVDDTAVHNVIGNIDIAGYDLDKQVARSILIDDIQTLIKSAIPREVVNGYQIIRRSGELILGYDSQAEKFVTARHRTGDQEWALGNYFTSWLNADQNFLTRLREDQA